MNHRRVSSGKYRLLFRGEASQHLGRNHPRILALPRPFDACCNPSSIIRFAILFTSAVLQHGYVTSTSSKLKIFHERDTASPCSYTVREIYRRNNGLTVVRTNGQMTIVSRAMSSFDFIVVQSDAFNPHPSEQYYFERYSLKNKFLKALILLNRLEQTNSIVLVSN